MSDAASVDFQQSKVERISANDHAVRVPERQ